MMNRQECDSGAAAVGEPALRAHPAESELDIQALRASALRQARRLVEFYRITQQELLDPLASSAQAAEPAATEPAMPVKYRHPASGETWDGVGLHPQWMRQALLQDGYRVEELRVNPVLEEHHARPAA